MSGRVDGDPHNAIASGVSDLAPALAPLPILFDDDDRFGGPALPTDHPKWLRDAVSLSSRARALIVAVKPVVTAAIAAWEHRVRSIVVGGRTVVVDASGSYRVD